MLPTLRQMQYFVALAETRSFVRAARVCHVTQSTLSAGIRQFETCLGAELVDRSGRSIALTDAGQTILDRVSGILRDAEDLAGAVRTARQPLSGRLRLGVIPSIAPYLLPQVLPGLRARYPDLRLHLREGLTGALMEALREGRLDVLLIAFPYDTQGLETEMIGEDPLLLAVPGDHAFAAGGCVSLHKLRDEPLLLLEDGHCLREHVLRAFDGAAPPESDEIQASSMTTLVQMVDNGLGITLLPRIAADAGVTRGTGLVLTPLEAPLATRELGLVWRRRSGHAADAQALAGALRAYLSERGRRTRGTGA